MPTALTRPTSPRKDPIALRQSQIAQTTILRVTDRVAPLRQHCHRRIDIDVQPHLAAQTVEVEEVHAVAQPTLHPVAARLADDQVACRLLQVVAQQ
jgi:hypothetical protein